MKPPAFRSAAVPFAFRIQRAVRPRLTFPLRICRLRMKHIPGKSFRIFLEE